MYTILVEEPRPRDVQHCAFDHDQEGAASSRPKKTSRKAWAGMSAFDLEPLGLIWAKPVISSVECQTAFGATLLPP
jgi:hypothetical protein